MGEDPSQSQTSAHLEHTAHSCTVTFPGSQAWLRPCDRNQPSIITFTISSMARSATPGTVSSETLRARERPSNHPARYSWHCPWCWGNNYPSEPNWSLWPSSHGDQPSNRSLCDRAVLPMIGSRPFHTGGLFRCLRLGVSSERCTNEHSFDLTSHH